MPEYLATTSSKSTIWEKARAETKKVGDWYVLTALPGIPLASEVKQLKQIHSGNIVRADRVQQAGELEADGWYVEEKGMTVSIGTADCLPLTIVSEKGALLLHVSRKSLIRGILDNTLTFIEPSKIDWVMMGPHICQLHFKFEEEGPLLRLFRLKYPTAVHFHQGVIMLSLAQAVKSVLQAWEVHPAKIISDNRCTYESLELPSYRKWLETGRQGIHGQLQTVIWRDPVVSKQ